MSSDVIERLEAAQDTLDRVKHTYRAAGTNRNTILEEALKAGVKQADIARVTGLTRSRVAQIKRTQTKG